MLHSLVSDLLAGKDVVFVTGAGLSVASGVPPYRQDNDGVWSHFAEDWGTREKFAADPLEWWNTFWLPTHEKPELMSAIPNDAHHAVARVLSRCANARVITQNIDTLHSQTIEDETRLIEVHGHVGLYKCVNEACENAVVSLTREDIQLDSLFVEGSTEKLKSAPVCPSCDQAVLPQALFFDEKYNSHPYYQWDRAIRWLERAHTIVFVGTSFSVGITHDALDIAFQSSKQVFNFNLTIDPLSSFSDVGDLNMQDWFQDRRLVTHVVGRCESTLPLLAWTTDRVANLRRSLREMSGEPPVPDVSDLDGEVFCQFLSGKKAVPESMRDNASYDAFAFESAEMEVGAALAVLGSPPRGGGKGSMFSGRGRRGKGKGKGKGRGGARATGGKGKGLRGPMLDTGAEAFDDDVELSSPFVRSVPGNAMRVIINLALLPDEELSHLKARLARQPVRARRGGLRKRARPPLVPDMAGGAGSDDDGAGGGKAAGAGDVADGGSRRTRRRLGSASSAGSPPAAAPPHIRNPGSSAVPTKSGVPEVSPSGAAMLLAGFGQQVRVTTND